MFKPAQGSVETSSPTEFILRTVRTGTATLHKSLKPLYLLQKDTDKVHFSRLDFPHREPPETAFIITSDVTAHTELHRLIRSETGQEDRWVCNQPQCLPDNHPSRNIDESLHNLQQESILAMEETPELPSFMRHALKLPVEKTGSTPPKPEKRRLTAFEAPLRSAYKSYDISDLDSKTQSVHSDMPNDGAINQTACESTQKSIKSRDHARKLNAGKIVDLSKKQLDDSGSVKLIRCTIWRLWLQIYIRKYTSKIVATAKLSWLMRL